MKAKKPVKTVGITNEVWAHVEAQAKALGTKPGKVINRILADAFSNAPDGLPLPKGMVLP